MKWIRKILCKLNLGHDLEEKIEEYPESEAFAVALYELRAEWDKEKKVIKVYMPTCTRCESRVAGFELRIRKWSVRPYAG